MDQKTSKLICRNYDINNSFDVHTDFCCSLNTGGSVAEWLEHRIWNLEVTWSKSCFVPVQILFWPLADVVLGSLGSIASRCVSNKNEQVIMLTKEIMLD